MKHLILIVFILLASRVTSDAQKEEQTEAKTFYILHKVQPGETIFSISKKYAVEQKDLLNVNPDLIMGLKQGQNLKVPVAGKDRGRVNEPAFQSDRGSVNQERLPSFEEYKVKKDDSFYFIAKRFGITVEDILKYNPEVRKGLEKSRILRIPDKNDLERIKAQERGKTTQPATTKPVSGERPLASSKDQKGAPLPCQPDIRASGQTYQIGLLLPLYLPANDTINRVRVTLEEMMRDSLLMDRVGSITALPVDSFRQRDHVVVYPRSENFIHFYEGVLLAADSLTRAGMHVQLHVYDTNQKRYVVDSLVRSGSLKGLDLIIGPIFPELQKTVADFALQNKIPMISPLSSSGNFEERNPWYFKVNSARQYLIQKTADYIADEYFDQNVIVLRMGEYSNLPEAELVRLVRDKLMLSADRAHSGKVLFHEYRLSADGSEGLKNLLSRERENIFIIPSETEAHISVAVTTLNALAEEYPVTLVGLSNFQRYRSIQTEYFHRIKLNYLTPYFVDYESPTVNQFIRKFRRNFAAEPNQYSFQGYDIAFYFMSALFRYGKDFIPCLSMLEVSLTQSELVFDRVNPDGGYMNNGLFIMQYEPDYDVIMKGITGIPPHSVEK